MCGVRSRSFSLEIRDDDDGFGESSSHLLAVRVQTRAGAERVVPRLPRHLEEAPRPLAFFPPGLGRRVGFGAADGGVERRAQSVSTLDVRGLETDAPTRVRERVVDATEGEEGGGSVSEEGVFAVRGGAGGVVHAEGVGVAPLAKRAVGVREVGDGGGARRPGRGRGRGG